MKAVSVADLKANLSGYLREVARGREIVIRKRNTPVARITPFLAEDGDETQLVAEGVLRPALQKASRGFWKEFWALDRPKVRSGNAVSAVLADRNER
jgi:prevent-host-death family protein